MNSRSSVDAFLARGVSQAVTSLAGRPFIQSCSHAHVEFFAENIRFGQDRSIVRCGDCGHVFMHPMPGDDELSAYYESEYRAALGSTSCVVSGNTKPVSRLLRRRPASQVSYILRNAGVSRFGRVLEVGAGSGLFLNEIRRLADEVVGLEPGAVAADHARQATGLEVLDESIPHHAEAHRSHYDLIALSHVLEHLPDPSDSLRHLRSAARENAVLFIEVPNLLGVPKHTYLKTPHLHFFSESTLRDCAVDAGWRVVDVSGYSYPDGWNLFSRADRALLLLQTPTVGNITPGRIYGSRYSKLVRATILKSNRILSRFQEAYFGARFSDIARKVNTRRSVVLRLVAVRETSAMGLTCARSDVPSVV